MLLWSRPPAILKVNCPEGAREGGLGHWFLSHRWERNSPPALRPQARFGAQPPLCGGSLCGDGAIHLPRGIGRGAPYGLSIPARR